MPETPDNVAGYLTGYRHGVTDSREVFPPEPNPLLGVFVLLLVFAAFYYGYRLGTYEKGTANG